MPDPQPSDEKGVDAIPETLPVLPLSDAILFPKMVLPLIVLEETSIQLIDDAMAGNRIVGLLASQLKGETQGYPQPEDLAAMGTSALILKMAKTDDNKRPDAGPGPETVQDPELFAGQALSAGEGDAHRGSRGKGPGDRGDDGQPDRPFRPDRGTRPGLPQEIAQMAQSIKDAGHAGRHDRLHDQFLDRRKAAESSKPPDVRDRLKRCHAASPTASWRSSNWATRSIAGQGRHGQTPTGVLSARAAQGDQGRTRGKGRRQRSKSTNIEPRSNGADCRKKPARRPIGS